jgi:putative heme iron utilization protein
MCVSESNGVHAVPARRFVLVAAQHPLITVRRLATHTPNACLLTRLPFRAQAIQENAGALQTADITQMPEQCVAAATVQPPPSAYPLTAFCFSIRRLVKISSGLYNT